MNKNTSCFEKTPEGWQRKHSNAALFANVANKLHDELLARDPDVQFSMWDDMYTPLHYGGSDSYQTNFGGVMGPTGCAQAPELLPGLCETVTDVTPLHQSIVMQPWSYKPDQIRKIYATAAWYEEQGRPWMAGPGGIELPIYDWATAARDGSSVLGVNAFHFHGDAQPISLSTFWNHDWRLRYLVDFETAESAFYLFDSPVFSSSNGTLDSTGACAANSSINPVYGGKRTYPHTNDGGLCVTPDVETLVNIDPVASSPNLHHQVVAHVRRELESSGTLAPEIRIYWDQGAFGESVSEWIEADLVETLDDQFLRFETDPGAFQSPPGTIALSVEIRLGSGGQFTSLDNVLLLEETPPCFDNCSE
jgi:hypothetical protein